MEAPTGYIDLARRFSKLDSSQRPEVSALRSYIYRARRDNSIVGWPELLELSVVVVLGEPGSGKSWELRNQCAQLQSKGEYAIFIELERLVANSIREVLSDNDDITFQKWKSGSSTCYFFLDSVDEAKIRRHADFYAALDKIINAIGEPRLKRARFVISSRISEWNPAIDKGEVLSRFGELHRGHSTESQGIPQDGQTSLQVFQIEPLDRDQVQIFIKRKNLADSESFVAALDHQHAWDFARRPIDVVDLAEFWTRKERLGTLTEIIENDISLKLRETVARTNQDPLTELRARRGAECLAASTVFCKQQQFKVPDDTFVAPNALNAFACLPPDWSQLEGTALLVRALFDSATYGQIRFHHRSIAEYLAASWLTERVRNGCPVRILQQLLFAEINGAHTLRRGLAPITAWLCSGNERWNSDIRDWTLKSAPEILLEFGDPSSLDITYRRKLLTSWVTRYGDRKQVWVRSSPETLRRLSSPALAADVSEFLIDSGVSVDVRVELTELVRHGGLLDCVETLATIAISPEQPDRLKQYALIALRDIGTRESHEKVWEGHASTDSLSPTTCDLLAQTLYPGTIGPAALTDLIRRVDVESANLHHLQWSLEAHLDESMPADHAEELLHGLNNLANDAPHILIDSKESRISQRHRWVIDVIPAVLHKLLGFAHLTESQTLTAAEALSLLGEARHFPNNYSKKWEGLNIATLRHSSLRQLCFWQDVDRARRRHPDREVMLHNVLDYDSVIDLEARDFAWALEDVETSKSDEDKTLALKLATGVKPLKQRSADERRQLKKAVRGRPCLTDILRRSDSAQRWHWFYRSRYLLLSGRLWQQLKYQNTYRLKDQWGEIRWQLMLYYRLVTRLLENDDNVLGYLCSEAAAEEEGHQWTVGDWNGLQKRRGKWIARAAKEGCKQQWRRYTPLLPHEKHTPNETDRRVIIGLSGLQASIIDGEISFSVLPEAEVELATRYAANELNGFPAWLHDLARDRPKAVTKVLNECVIGEWEYPAAQQQVHDVLARLASEGGLLAKLARNSVLTQLNSRDPQNQATLEHAISLLLKTLQFPDSELAEIALTRCRTSPVDGPSFALWATVGFQLAANQTISIIKERLDSTAVSRDVFLRICSLLGGGRRERLKLINQPDFFRIESLHKLIPLVYQYVSAEDDIRRGGEGPYSPTTRDEAQEFRSSLLSRVAESEEPIATRVLSSLLMDEKLAPHHDWIRHLVDERLKKDAEQLPWTPNDIRSFATEYETAPKTDRELFQIVLNRLDDIKHDVEASDNSLRDELQEGSDEASLRRYLARKLQERSRQRYTIPQETEIDQQQRPDLRAENPQMAPVSIEIKLAHKWSVPELRAGLEGQLIGQYLRAHNSRYGIYVLGIHGPDRYWIGEGGTRLNFVALCSLLESHANEVSNGNTDFDGIKVVGIDFRSPAQVESS